MTLSIDQSKAAARHALTVGIFATDFHGLLTAKRLIVGALADLEDIPDQEAERLAMQLAALLGDVEEAIAEARGIVSNEPAEAVSHRPGARQSSQLKPQVVDL